MITCPICGGGIHGEHVQRFLTPQGRPWRVEAACEHCGVIIVVRLYQGSPDAVSTVNSSHRLNRLTSRLKAAPPVLPAMSS